jgi:acetyl-CoA acetyltransferase
VRDVTSGREVAIVGVGVVPYTRRPTRTRSLTGLAVDACLDAITDAGVDARDVDGICTSTSAFWDVQMAIGTSTKWAINMTAQQTFIMQLVEAVNAVRSGACDIALVCHSFQRPLGARETAAAPFRRAPGTRVGAVLGTAHVMSLPLGFGYAAWANRYLHEYGGDRREDLGLIAINARTNAADNVNAVYRAPINLDDYRAARLVRDPFRLLDLDVAVDGADAVIVASADIARDLSKPPVYVHHANSCRTNLTREDQIDDLRHTGQDLVMDALWRDTELRLADIDILYPYDGFSFLNLLWLESMGWCERGEGLAFLRDQWNDEQQRLLINGRTPMNTHGGQLSEGASLGAGFIREAVQQLRGDIGNRQVAGARHALATIGGFTFNCGAALLSREPRGA